MQNLPVPETFRLYMAVILGGYCLMDPTNKINRKFYAMLFLGIYGYYYESGFVNSRFFSTR